MDKTIKLQKHDVEKIIQVCGNDGHTIINPVALDGVNPDFVSAVTQRYDSDRSDPKRMIETRNGIVDHLTGVYTLDALRRACLILNLPNDAGRYFGRGRQAQAYTAALSEWVRR